MIQLKYQIKALKSELEVKRLLNRTTRNFLSSGIKNLDQNFKGNSNFGISQNSQNSHILNKSAISRKNEDLSALSDDLIENYIREQGVKVQEEDWNVNFETFN